MILIGIITNFIPDTVTFKIYGEVMSFVHLHNHSHYSTLDGLSKPKDMIKAAKDLGQTAMAITDHGNMMGVIEFYKEAKKAGIKPIIGSEFYIVENRKIKDRHERRNHLILLAKNIKGYENLIKLSSESNINHFYHKPRIDRELLEIYSEGLIVMSACLAGEIPEALLKNDIAKAKETALWYKDLFGKENFYLEIQHHPDLLDQEKANNLLIKLSEELDIGLVATNDSHYVKKDDDVIQDALICINTGKMLSEKEGRLCMLGGDYSIVSTEEMHKRFAHVPQALENTLKIADSCELKLEFGRKLMPRFECPKGLSEDEYLEKLCYEGLKVRYTETEITDEITDRLKFELETVKKMGYPGYFLIVQDFVNWGKSNGVLVGPGRGSAAGSLISYLTGITNVDPLKYGLLFERFLNPDRISMPDIDIDFQDDKRDMVLDYVRKKYGEDNVVQVVTYQTMGAKNSIRDIGRVMGFPIDDVNKICNLIPQKAGTTIQKALKDKDFRHFYENNPNFKDLIDTAGRIEGTIRGTGTHACAVIISPVPADELVPLQYPPKEKNTVITQFEGNQLDDIGLLKMDFLGIRNLTIISEAVELIKKNRNTDINIDKIPFRDRKTFNIYSRGMTNGIFQFESAGMKKYLKDLKPNRFEDLVAMNALFRPGPMQYIPDYISRKNGKSVITYDHPLMEKYLKDTYGITVYQEQVMLLSRELAGFTRGESDNLRKAMGKKIRKMMDQLKEKFISGCLNNEKFISGFSRKKDCTEPRDLAIKIWSDWENFAEYAFNKSHSVCYAYVSYLTAYLKANYPLEFMSAMLNSVKDKSEDVLKYIDECANLGIKIRRPDVNYSENYFAPTGKNEISFGLQAIKNVGGKAIESIIITRNTTGAFNSIYDFLERIDGSKVNKRVIEHLAMAGALDSLGHKRSQMAESLDTLLPHFQKVSVKKADWDVSLFGESSDEELAVDHPPLADIEEWDKSRMLDKEKELIGFYVSGHPLDEQLEIVDFFNTKKTLDPENFTDGEEFVIGGKIKEVFQRTTKAGKEMAKVTVILPRNETEVTIFPRVFSSFRDGISPGNVLFFKHKVKKYNGEFKVFVEDVFNYEQAVEKFNSLTRRIRINIDPARLDVSAIKDLTKFIAKNKGDKELYFKICCGADSFKLRSDSYKVNGSFKFIKGLRDMLGEGSIDFS